MDDPLAVLVPGYRGRLRVLERWRVGLAAETVRAHGGGRVVVSGHGGEAERMAARVPPGVDVAIEPTARSTSENVERSVPFLESATAIAIASDRFHVRRAEGYLRQLRPDLAERLVPPHRRWWSGWWMDAAGGAYEVLLRARLALGRLPAPLRRRWARPFVARSSRLLARLDRRLASSGRRTVGGWVAGGAPVLLLTTTGRRSGRRHTTPLLFHRDDDGSLLLVAANGTADWAPDWYRNLVADPNVEVEVDGVRQAATAVVLAGEARTAAYERACRALPGLEAATAAARRPIPLVRLALDPS